MRKMFSLKTARNRSAVGTSSPTVFRVMDGGNDLENTPTYCIQAQSTEIYVSKKELQDVLLAIEEDTAHGCHAKSC